MARTIFIGDVHGCLEELRELVEEKIRPTAGDRIIMLGDLVNRGPNSAGVVKYVMGRGFESLLGNHEERYARKWQKQEWGCAELRAVLTDEQHAWIVARPLFLETKDFVAVHAGLLPGKDLAGTLADPDGERAVTRARMIAPDGTWTDRLELPGGKPWWELHREKRPVFYGHWGAQGVKLGANGTYGLDSGCLYGGALSGYCLETKELFQAKARRTYVVPGE